MRGDAEDTEAEFAFADYTCNSITCLLHVCLVMLSQATKHEACYSVTRPLFELCGAGVAAPRLWQCPAQKQVGQDELAKVRECGRGPPSRGQCACIQAVQSQIPWQHIYIEVHLI